MASTSVTVVSNSLLLNFYKLPALRNGDIYLPSFRIESGMLPSGSSVDI
jgi:hypothetical protein